MFVCVRVRDRESGTDINAARERERKILSGCEREREGAFEREGKKKVGGKCDLFR